MLKSTIVASIFTLLTCQNSQSSEKPVPVHTLIIDPIAVKELTPEQRAQGITDNAFARLTISGVDYDVPKTGATISLPEGALIEGDSIHSRLCIYDRQDINREGKCFIAGGRYVVAINGVAHMYYKESGPKITFQLMNKTTETSVAR